MSYGDLIVGPAWRVERVQKGGLVSSTLNLPNLGATRARPGSRFTGRADRALSKAPGVAVRPAYSDGWSPVNKATRFPLGSWKKANHPCPGISLLACTIFPPNFSICFKDASISSVST